MEEIKNCGNCNNEASDNWRDGPFQPSRSKLKTEELHIEELKNGLLAAWLAGVLAGLQAGWHAGRLAVQLAGWLAGGPHP